MALAGLRPVVEMRVVDFALCGMDEIVNQAAKNRFMFGGQGRVPMVVRMPTGIWDASAAQHSQSLESWFAHLPGVVVVCPATPQDNYWPAARRDGLRRPGGLHGTQDAVGPEGEVDTSQQVPLGRARTAAPRQPLTVVSWSRQVQACEAACGQLARHRASRSN
jgi:acetoin:2,6-dichlorophenolindophenol oxidoreductase subunit beta